MLQKISIVWFRRDLRLQDNAAFFFGLQNNVPVVPIFIFDKNILNELPKTDSRVTFIHNAITLLHNKLLSYKSGLEVYHSTPIECFEHLFEKYDIQHVYLNHDYEPYAKQRDEEVKQFLESKNCSLQTYKDQVVFEKSEIVKEDNTPYTVYTPYSKKWKQELLANPIKEYNTDKFLGNLLPQNETLHIPTLSSLGFEKSTIDFPATILDTAIITNYHTTRDIPSIQGTSKLSVHLRFGTISIRALVLYALQHNEKYLNELIWREFYQQILWHFPYVVSSCFKQKYDTISWQNNPNHFEAWCGGKTGYPIVDAGMRELNTTGWMHNRVRMIVASFLTKHLQIDWRWGEAYFAEKLIDYDLASNNGGWQWAAGCGVDAAPYFRIFNPYLQTEKFDAQHIYIKKWVPEFGSFDYVAPIVVHEEARKRCLEMYKHALQ